MSMTTENFNFFKPELSDPADITELNANWDRIDAELANVGTQIVTADSTNGVSYTATVPYLTELYTGLEITIIPSQTSTSTSPTLNVNGFGAKSIKLPLSTNTTATVAPGSANFFVKDKAVKLMFDGSMWKTVDKQRTSATDLYGTVPIVNGGTGANNATQARTNLGAISIKTITVTLSASGWSSMKQTVNATGVTADNTVFTTHAPSAFLEYRNCGVRLYSQASGKLTFMCEYKPASNITVNVAIFE